MGTVNQMIAFDAFTVSWLEGPIEAQMKVLSATLPEARAGLVVEARVTASAQGSFYYSLIENSGAATPLTPTMRAINAVQGWAAMEATALFEVTESQVISFSVLLDKGDLKGDMKIFNLTLIVKAL